jgi:hypothetical protein
VNNRCAECSRVQVRRKGDAEEDGGQGTIRHVGAVPRRSRPVRYRCREYNLDSSISPNHRLGRMRYRVDSLPYRTP